MLEYYKFYQENGFVIIPQLNAKNLDYLRSLDKLITEKHHKPAQVTNSVQELEPQVKKIMGYQGIFDFMSLCVGGEPLGVDAQYSFGNVKLKGFLDHQDNFYAQSPYGCYASAWTAIDDADVGNGCLYVIPKSHLLPTINHVDSHQVQDDKQPRTARAIVVDYPINDNEKLPAIMKSGDVIFIHGNVIHGSFDNNSERTRRNLLLTFVKEKTFIRDGNYVKRTPFKLERWA